MGDFPGSLPTDKVLDLRSGLGDENTIRFVLPVYDVKVKVLTHPQTQDLQLAKVLHALSDPVRLKLVRMLAAERDLTCGALCLGRPKSSMSHYLKTMIDAGLLRVDVAGNIHLNNLRLDDLEARFPGLMTAVLGAAETISQEPESQINTGKRKR